MPRKIQSRPDDALSSAEVRHFVSLIRKGDPDIEGSKALLRLFCERAKRLQFPVSPFPKPLLDLIITAFEGYLSNEEKDLAKSLGLKRRGRPPKQAILKRNLLIAVEVFRLVAKGNSLMPSRTYDGALCTVAEQYGLSESEVRDIYYKYKIDAMGIILNEQLFEDDSA